MEVTVLNSSLARIGVIDSFISLIWTDRYWEAGDFEIEKVPDISLFTLLSDASYFIMEETDHAMILETIHIKTDEEKGTRVYISGNSLEYLLERRIIIEPTTLTGNFQTAIQQLLNENVISPTDTNRDITEMEFQSSTDPAITGLTIDEQYYGENLYEVISSLCASRGIGFKLWITDTGKFRFELYAGVDRSYGQTTNSWVVFSPNMDNLLNSDYIASTSKLKTVSLVLGEKGVGNFRDSIVVSLSGGGGTGVNRREMTTDASDVSRNTPDGPLSDEDYITLLQERGGEDLYSNAIIESFDGEADITEQHIF
ncbi:MAG: hypothetical protein FK734_11125 [Asgard group archaeon]|nr:hypothetical protein [Asgard group archaeon]